MDTEPALVVERRKELTYLLCQAAELEHGIMCQYLYAAFSLKQGAGVAVERWRSVLLAISREEMLHWALVQNLLVAVGSAPYVSRPHMPHAANGYPPGVVFRLLPFGRAALQHFLFLERPPGVELSDAEGLITEGTMEPPMRADEVVPRPQNFTRVGHLYRSIEQGLAHLADKLGEKQLFIGPAIHQMNERAFGWSELTPIVDLAGATAAVDRIVEQGEGASGDWSTAHFGRFLEVQQEYEAILLHDPGFEAAYPVLGAGMRAVDGIEPEYYITDPVTGMTSDLCNAVYELLLQVIARYFAFGHETSEEHDTLAWVCIALMIEALEPLGTQLALMEVGPEYPGKTAGANFQLPYRSNFLLPHRRAAWIRFVERLCELAEFARDINPEVADALAGMAAKLDPFIESV